MQSTLIECGGEAASRVAVRLVRLAKGAERLGVGRGCCCSRLQDVVHALLEHGGTGRPRRVLPQRHQRQARRDGDQGGQQR